MIENTAEVQRVLDGSSIALCLDTGHLLIGGTDPAELTRQAPERIAHVHFKDVDAAKAKHVQDGRWTYTEGVTRGMYRPLGTGDVDVAAIVGHLTKRGYDGWYTLEQDTILQDEPTGEGPSPTSGPARTTCARSCGARDDERRRARTRVAASGRHPRRGPHRRAGDRQAGARHRDPARHRGGPRPAARRGLRRRTRRRAGDGLLRRRAGRPRGRGRLQPAAERVPRAVEPGRRRGRQARPVGEAVRLHRGGGHRGARRGAGRRGHGGGGLPLPVPPGDAAAVRAAGLR